MGFASRTLSIRESAPVKLAVANLTPFEKLREDSPTIVAPAFSGDGLRSKKNNVTGDVYPVTLFHTYSALSIDFRKNKGDFYPFLRLTFAAIERIFSSSTGFDRCSSIPASRLPRTSS